jgi:hypothetical protein
VGKATKRYSAHRRRGGLSGFLDTVDIYRYKTNDFVPAVSLPTMNSLRANETATALPSGKVLIAGGRDSLSTLKSVDR